MPVAADDHIDAAGVVRRIDVQDARQQSDLDPRRLSSFERILLSTDGTVTEILEAHLFESIRLVKISQTMSDSEPPIPYLELGTGEPLMMRKILLQGKYTHRNYIYAESVIVPARLSAHIGEDLMVTEKPIGLIMLQARLETFREVLVCKLRRANEVAEYFGIPEDSMLISRTYRVLAGGQPIMLITEQFPQGHFNP